MFKIPTQLSYTQDLLIQSNSGERFEVLISFPDIFVDSCILLNTKTLKVSDQTVAAIKLWQIVKTQKRLQMLEGELAPTRLDLDQLQELSNTVSFLIIQDLRNA